jgi:hypothetical protein
MVNKDVVKRFAKSIDDKIDWVKILKRPLLGTAIELVDNIVLPEGLDLLNDKYGDKIPIKYVDEIEDAMECFIIDDYEGMLSVLPEGLDDAIDLIFLDDDFEAIFFATNFNAALKAAKYYAQKKVV